MTDETDGNHDCPFNHTRMCPHHLYNKHMIWCTICILDQILKEMKLIGARQQ